MWRRRLSLSGSAAGIVVEDAAVEGGACRLVAALLRLPPPGDHPAEASGMSLIAAAWRDERGGTLWGWPGEDGVISLRQSAESCLASVLLPPAVSLALALRRAGVEMGAQALILGAGTAAGIARIVAQACGCRMLPLDGGSPTSGPAVAEADLVIVAGDDPALLRRALTSCKSWGAVFAFGDALKRGPLDYYTEIHRRALALHAVPFRPRLLPEETDRLERGKATLARDLGGQSLPSGAVLAAVDRSGALLGEVVSDGNGLGSLRVAGES